MLSLKFATGYVDLTLERKRYDADMLKLQRDLARFPGSVKVAVDVNAAPFRKGMVLVRQELAKLRTFTIGVRVDRGRAAADLNLLRQQAEQMQRRSFGTIAIRANLRPWRTAIKSVAMDIYRLRRFANIPLGFTNTSNAHAQLNLLQQHMKSAQGLAKFKMGIGIGRGGGGGFSGGGGGFISGVGQGLGLPFATSPQMMAGQIVGGSARASVGTAAGIQTQVAELRRVSGMTGSQAQGFKQSLFGVGMSQAGVSINDLMEIAQIGGRAGVADREGPTGLLTFTKDLAMVKNAVADMPTEELAESMMKVLNVFELGTDRVAGFGSALTAMDNVSVASARDILNITTRLSGTAHAIGLTLPQITAFASVLKDVGLSNEVAGTSFSQIFRKMATDSHEFAAEIGVDAKTFADAYRRDPMEALGMVIGKFNEMKDTIEGQEFLDELGLKGARVTGSLQQLASKFELVEGRAKMASTETGTLNALMTANALKSDTLEASFTKLKNALTALSDALGAAFLGPATAATNALAGLVKSISMGDTSVLTRTLALSIGPEFDAEGRNKETRRKELEDWFMKNILGSDPAEAAKPIVAGAGNALPAKKPEIVGPPRPVGDPHAAENLLFNVGNRLSGALGALADTRQSLLGAGGRALSGVASNLAPAKKEKQTFASGLSGEEVSRRIQSDIFNMTKDKSGEETAKNTKPLAGLLGEIKDILKNSKQGVQNAVLGQ